MAEAKQGNGPNGKGRWDPFSIFLSVACIALAVLVLLLARQNRELKKQIAAGTGLGALPERALKTGETIPPFELIDSAGEARAFDEVAGGRSLLLVFSVHCPACTKTLPVWEELVSDAAPATRVLGIRTDSDEDAGAEATLPQAFPFPVYGVDRERAAAFLERIPYIPATVVVSDGGKVEKVWFGMLAEDDRAVLREMLGSAAVASRGP